MSIAMKCTNHSGAIMNQEQMQYVMANKEPDMPKVLWAIVPISLMMRLHRTSFFFSSNVRLFRLFAFSPFMVFQFYMANIVGLSHIGYKISKKYEQKGNIV